MTDDRDARIEQLEAKLRQAHDRHAVEREGLRLSLAAADARETATAAILRSMTAFTTDAQPVLDAIVHSAQQLSDSVTAGLEIRRDDALLHVAKAGEFPGTPHVGSVALLS